MNVGDRVVLRFRPLTGKGKIEREPNYRGEYRVLLENGMKVLAQEADLLPDLISKHDYGN